jgi:hypothetical protein
MLSRVSLASAVLLMTTAFSFAQTPLPIPLPFPSYQGTAEDQKACDPPVQKFCRAAIPDQFRVLRCLQENRDKIGKACQAVLTSYGQ